MQALFLAQCATHKILLYPLVYLSNTCKTGANAAEIYRTGGLRTDAVLSFRPHPADSGWPRESGAQRTRSRRNTRNHAIIM